MHASMPPSEHVKLVLAMAAEDNRKGVPMKVMLIDIGGSPLVCTH